MRTAVVVLTKAGLGHARRLQEVLPGETRIFGPSCVVGACAGPDLGVRPGPGETFPTGEPGVFGWLGSIRTVFPTVQASADAVVAVMPVGSLARLAYPGDANDSPGSVAVAVDDPARFAICLSEGDGPGAALTHQVAAALGATPVVTVAERSPLGWPEAADRNATAHRPGTRS